jgi:hypothetical protein
MKKKMIAGLIALSLGFSFAPQKAEAALVVSALSRTGAQASGLTIGIALGWATLGFVAVDGRPNQDEWANGIFWVLFAGPAILGIALDVDAQVSSDQMVEGFKKAFPFVDNSEVLTDLSVRAKEKLNDAIKHDPEAKQFLVQFSEREVQMIFNGVDLSAEQLDLLVQALR